MKMLATTALTIAFLSAGAFAGDSNRAQRAVVEAPSNMTVINKNQAWPFKGLITVEPCSYNHCIDI